MDVDTTIALGRLFGRVKEQVVETYKNLGERMPDDDLISVTLVTLYEQGYTHPAELESALLTRLRPIRKREMAGRFGREGGRGGADYGAHDETTAIHVSTP
jgi:hypothetical protein